MSNVNGHIILNTPIAVDIWKRGTDKYVHFLSHCHTDHTVGLSSTWRLPIYTTDFNAWMLKNKFKIKSHLLRCLSTGDYHIIRVPTTGEEFTVTLIDANHCPGSVMFLFQGSFGTILYTGDFRYDPIMLENKVLAHVMKNQLLDVLYIDNTYASPYSNIPSRKEAAQQVVRIIRDHPQHKILLGLHNLGKEELLSIIALEFCEKICVSEDRLAILHKLQYEDVFTTDPECCRIHVVSFNSVAYHMKKRQKEHPHIAIIPTGLHMCGFDDESAPCRNTTRHGIYVVPYSDHSNYEEIFTFISHLKPSKLYPIVNETKVPSKEVLHCKRIKMARTDIDSLSQLCRKKGQESTNSQSKELAVSHKVLPAHLWCDIRHTKSQHRPRIAQRKKLSEVPQKKGVQFESSFTSDDGDETLKTYGKHTTKLERKDTYSGIRVNHSDSYSVHEYCRERPSENKGGVTSCTMPSHNSGGRISPSKNTVIESEGFGRCSSTYNSNTIIAQENASDNDQISLNSLSDVMKPHTTSLGGTAECEQEFEDRVWSDSTLVKEERTQELSIMPDGEDGDLPRHRTEDTVKYPMVWIPIHSDTAPRMMESSELNNATEETKIHGQQTCPSGLRTRGWNKRPRFHSYSRDSGITINTKQKCLSLSIPRPPRPSFPCDINATRATQITTCKSNFHKASDDRIQISSVKSLQTSTVTSAANMLQSDTESSLQFSPSPTLLTCSDAQCHTASEDRIQITSVTSLETSHCSREPNMLQSDTGHSLQFSAEPTQLTCKDVQCHKASEDRIQITSVKSLKTSDWSREPNLLRSGTGCSLKFSPAPTLLTRSDVQCHTSEDRIQITSLKSLKTSDWSREPNLLRSGTGCSLKFSPAPTLLTRSDAQCHTSEDRIQITSVKSLKTSDWSREPNLLQSDAQCHTSEDRIQITSVKSLKTSDWSREPNLLQSGTGCSLKFSPAPTLLTCSDAQCHTSEDRIQITSVKSLQTSDWSREPNMMQSDTGCSLQLSPAPTLLTCSDAQSHDTGILAVTGCHTNSKKSNHLALVTEENRVTSRLNTRDRITSNKETRISSESCSHSFARPDKNSSVPQNEQSLNHRPLSSHMLQTDGLRKAAVQCEEIMSKNAARIMPSFQQMEVVTAESDGLRSGQSDRSGKGTVARRKPVLSEHQLSNISVVGSKRNSECSNPETSVVMTHSANVDESYSYRKRCNHNSGGQKNKATLRSDSILQNSNNNNTGGQSMDQNEATVFADKSPEHRKHTNAVSSTSYNSKEYNRTPTDECKTFVCPGMPLSTHPKNCNYWTNGNKVPFAIHEVRQAVQHLPF